MLYKSISGFCQNGGCTCTFSGVVVHKYPLFYSGHKSKYTKSTYEFLREDILSKIEDEIRNEFESEIDLINPKFDMEQKKQQIEQNHNFDTAYPVFGMVLKDQNNEDMDGGAKYMLVFVNNWNEGLYDDLRDGQVVSCNHLYPDSFHFRKFSFPLVFKTIKQSKIQIQNTIIKGIDTSDVGQYYEDFRKTIIQDYTKSSKDGVMNIETTNYGFVDLTGIIVKVFDSTHKNNSAKQAEVISLLIITSRLTLVTVNTHEASFLLKKQASEGEVIWLTNLNYENSSEFDNENNMSHITMSKYSVKKPKKAAETTYSSQASKSSDNISEEESDCEVHSSLYDQFKTTDFTEIHKKSKLDPQKLDMTKLNELLKTHASVCSPSKNKKFASVKKSKLSPLLEIAGVICNIQNLQLPPHPSVRSRSKGRGRPSSNKKRPSNSRKK